MTRCTDSSAPTATNAATTRRTSSISLRGSPAAAAADVSDFGTA